LLPTLAPPETSPPPPPPPPPPLLAAEGSAPCHRRRPRGYGVRTDQIAPEMPPPPGLVLLQRCPLHPIADGRRCERGHTAQGTHGERGRNLPFVLLPPRPLPPPVAGPGRMAPSRCSSWAASTTRRGRRGHGASTDDGDGELVRVWCGPGVPLETETDVAVGLGSGDATDDFIHMTWMEVCDFIFGPPPALSSMALSRAPTTTTGTAAKTSYSSSEPLSHLRARQVLYPVSPVSSVRPMRAMLFAGLGTVVCWWHPAGAQGSHGIVMPRWSTAPVPTAPFSGQSPAADRAQGFS